MPLAGWALGLTFASVVKDVDHWIAFVLLALIGGHMIHEARAGAPGPAAAGVPLARGWPLFGAAVATSIDAAVAGMTLTLFEQPVLVACAVIGFVTLVFATAGVLVGSMAGARAGSRPQILGGLVLIALGTKILVEHVFFDG
jgi:putative Mn2+ efflux pump MntP